MRTLRIGLTYNSKDHMYLVLKGCGLPVTDDALEEYDTGDTIQELRSALKVLGHDVIPLGWGQDLVEDLSRGSYPDLVFNIAEGFNGRAREAQVPALLEMLDIRFVGSDAFALATALDKNAAKLVVNNVGVRVADGWVANKVEDVRRGWFKRYPMIVKPNNEGSSRGISKVSVVHNQDELRERVADVLASYKQPALVEEYIEGRELTVGLVGDPVQVLGIMEVSPLKPRDEFIYSIEVKRNWRELVSYECPARLTATEQKYVQEAAVAAFTALGCKDMARVDFRLTREGTPVFLEINPLPGLSPTTSDLCIMAAALGISHHELVGRILKGAVDRYSLNAS
jgi:D-alanine-D-alanine ligase